MKKISEDLKSQIISSELPEKLIRKLSNRLKDEDDSSLWAVRSSAVAEDLEGASFAGQYDTVLSVSGIEEISKAILKCWASFFNAHSIQYRRENKISDFLGAVVLQNLVDADAAGVCFSIDPVSNDKNTIVINSNFGLGESVVSGIVTPDSFYVDKKELTIDSKQISDKSVKIISSRGGSKEILIEGRERDKQSICNNNALKVAQLIIKVEEHKQRPVDIEWAIHKDKVFLLQSRPITTTNIFAAPPKDWVPELNTPIDQRYPIYSNGNISEVLPDA